MINKDEVLENKEKFISLISEITREGFNKEGLLKKLNDSDFFTTPASTQYHNCFEGGLCLHSLNVYDQLNKLIIMENMSEQIDKNSILITSLLHDISKMNFYESSERNTKDEKGNWIKVPFIKVKDNKDRFLYGNHEMNSLYMIETFIPLSIEESVAILHHMGGKSYDSSQEDITPIFNRYSLSILLHTADLLATFINERI